MTSFLNLVKTILGWSDNNIDKGTSKRNRLEDVLDADDGAPPRKVYRSPRSVNVISMPSDEEHLSPHGTRRPMVRYVPVTLEPGASTSTPYSALVNEYTQSKWEKQLPPKVKKSPTFMLKVDDDDQIEEGDDVIFINRIKPTLPPTKIIEFHEPDPTYTKFDLSLKRRHIITTGRSVNKLKSTGISKSYKKEPPISKWIQTLGSPAKRAQLNGNVSKSFISKLFNMEERQQYQDLIKKTTGRSLSKATCKALETINLCDDTVPKESKSFGSNASTNASKRLDNITTLKDSFDKISLAKGLWLENKDKQWKEQQEELKKELASTEEERRVFDKLNKEAVAAILQYNLKSVLPLPFHLLEKPVPKVELPELTLEQDKIINRALGSGNPDQLLIEKFNLKISRRDIKTLGESKWLNDEVINFYMSLLMERSSQRPDLPKVYATNTFFYPRLMQSGHSGLRRWTRKVDIFAHDLMAIPVHLGVHWCMCLVDFKAKKVNYLDSMGAPNAECLRAVMQYLRDEHQDKKGAPLEEGWTTRSLTDIPQQMNGNDCGMFSCTFAEFASRRAPFAFTQAHMPYLRRKTVLEIVKGELLL